MTNPTTIQYKRALSDPLPAEWHARQARPTYNWCQQCHMPSHGTVCTSCAEPEASTPPAQATIEMGPLPDPEPLPAAWASFRPDMSCYVDAPTSAAAIDCPALTWAISQGDYSINSQYHRAEYQGRMETDAQEGIIDWMRHRGGESDHHWRCRLTTDTYDLSIVCMGSQTTIELIDYGTTQQMGGVA